MHPMEANGPVEEGILETLAYFALFRYPLLPGEIHRFHPVRCTPGEVSEGLGSLLKKGRVTLAGDVFYAPPGGAEWAAERVAGNDRARSLLARSARYTRIMRSFPFVEAVAISGSLSKQYAGKEADIDYFILTASDRLWIARTLLHLFKKLTFLTGHQHCFCMNYFIDRSATELADHNKYTAIELLTLIPVFCPERVAELKSANPWARKWLPNYPQEEDTGYVVPAVRGLLKPMAEWLIDRAAPRSLNRFLMGVTDRKWRRKWRRKGFPMEEYDHAFFTAPNVSKNHPANFGRRVPAALDRGGNLPKAWNE